MKKRDKKINKSYVNAISDELDSRYKAVVKKVKIKSKKPKC